MKNWIENSLTVIGSEEEINRFYQIGLILNDNEPDSWSLEPYYPYPNGEINDEWCLQHWGTTWDANKVLAQLEKNAMYVSFYSEFKPPIKWLKKVQQDFPTLKFKLLFLDLINLLSGIAYTEVDQNSSLPYIEDTLEKCKEFANRDNEIVTYDSTMNEFVVTSTGLVVHDWLRPLNHFENYRCWFE